MKIMYDFNGGAVVLGIRDGKYYIVREGDEQFRLLTDEQASNPMLAVRDYVEAIRDYLRSRAKASLRAHNGNTVFGCKINDNCPDCEHRGEKGSRCMWAVDKEEMA